MKKYLITAILLFSFVFVPNLKAENVYSITYGAYNQRYCTDSNCNEVGYAFTESLTNLPVNFLNTGFAGGSTYNLYAMSVNFNSPVVGNAVGYKINGYVDIYLTGLNFANGPLETAYIYYNEGIIKSSSNTNSVQNLGNNTYRVNINSVVSLESGADLSKLRLYIGSYNLMSCDGYNLYCSSAYANITGINVDITLYADNSSIEIQQNETIINQNENIINNQNKTNDLIEGESEDTESSKCGMICKLKAIWKGIINLPGLIIEGLVGLFIPSDMDFINNFVDSIENKLGFIASVPIQFIEFGLNLITLNVEEMNSISLPTISIFGYNFWNAEEIDLTVAKNIFQPYKIYTNITCVIICVIALFKMYENFTGGDK